MNPYWMIERNSRHTNMPEGESVMWFAERICKAQGNMDRWTPHSHKARHFETKQDAEKYLNTILTADENADYEIRPEVTEHMDCMEYDTPAEQNAVAQQDLQPTKSERTTVLTPVVATATAQGTPLTREELISELSRFQELYQKEESERRQLELTCQDLRGRLEESQQAHKNDLDKLRDAERKLAEARADAERWRTEALKRRESLL